MWIRGGGEEKILNPAHISVGPDFLVTVAEGALRARFVLLLLGQFEEFNSLVFEHIQELHGNAMVDDLEEPEILARFDQNLLGVRIGKVDNRNLGENVGGGVVACLEVG